MKKPIETLKTIAKVGKIISQIIFICCIVGIIGCLVGLVILLGVNLFGTNFAALFISNTDIAIETIVFACISGLITCICEGILAKYANNYFKMALAQQTPFTLTGSQEMFRLGVLTIALPLGAILIQDIGYGIFHAYYPACQQFNINGIEGIGLGVMFIILSVIFKYGAELEEK